MSGSSQWGWAIRVTTVEENRDLRTIIFNRIHEKGKIPFSEFMDLCLYHPIHGYYNTREEKTGKRGDYYTSPTVHSVFGRLLARQLREMAELLGKGPFWVIEAGAGKGTLAKNILDVVAQEYPSLFERLRYGIVESSPSFIEEQKIGLAPHGEKVAWLDLHAVEAATLQGCFLANEFADAFPVHRVVFENGKLQEIYVTEEAGNFREILGEPSAEEIPQYLDDLEVRLDEGQRAEVSLAVLKWFDRVGRAMRRGFLLIIDYGYVAQELYDSRRRSGTLTCYFRHTCSNDPYRHVGLQDMTSHVNFSGLIKKGESMGFVFTGFVPQYQFLLSLGFLDEVGRLREKGLSAEDSLMEGLTMKRLILPNGGMGDTFKVLIQHKGISEVHLRGLRPL